MGYLKSVGTSIIYIGAFLAAITFIPGIPPNSKFTEYSFVGPKKLTDDLAFNERLSNIEILLKGQLKGPEDFASYNGELYTGLHGGYIVKITDKKIIPIVKFGKDCDGLWQESICGRPLGLKFDDKGNLYVADTYYGIFKVDVETGKYERLVSPTDPIEGIRPMMFNSVDIASNGDVYWTDSSIEFLMQDGLFSCLTNPTGRVLRYDVKTKKNYVLLHNLAFANGIALSSKEDFLIVAETLASRITKYNLKGPNAGKRETFIQGLPGMPDNINLDNRNGFFVSLISYGDENLPMILQSLTPHPYIRRMAARLLALLEVPFKYLQMYYPNYYSEKMIHFIGHFEMVTFLIPKIATILRIDNNGKIVDAAYSTDERIQGISTAFIHNEFLYLGSPFLEYVPRVPLRQAFPNLFIEEKEKFMKTEKLQKKTNANINNQHEPTTTTKTPKVVESKPATMTTPKPVELKETTSETTKPVKSKQSTQPPKPVETKSSTKPSKASSNQQKSSHSNEKKTPKK